MKVPRTFTVLYRSQTATNAQHRANGFDGYFFSSFRNKSHTGRHAAKQGANLAVQLKNGFDRNSYRRFTVLYRSEIATNAQHRANGFGG